MTPAHSSAPPRFSRPQRGVQRVAQAPRSRGDPFLPAAQVRNPSPLVSPFSTKLSAEPRTRPCGLAHSQRSISLYVPRPSAHVGWTGLFRQSKRLPRFFSLSRQTVDPGLQLAVRYAAVEPPAFQPGAAARLFRQAVGTGADAAAARRGLSPASGQAPSRQAAITKPRMPLVLFMVVSPFICSDVVSVSTLYHSSDIVSTS